VDFDLGLRDHQSAPCFASVRAMGFLLHAGAIREALENAERGPHLCIVFLNGRNRDSHR
jgi:hypothetical protein